MVAALGDALEPDWSGSLLATCLRWFLSANYTTRTHVVERLWGALHAGQQPDGSYSVDEGENAAEATLQALAVGLHLSQEQQ